MIAGRRPDDLTIYGDGESGYIITPTLPHDLSPAPPEPTPGTVRDAIAAYAERRPALKESTGHYLSEVTSLLDDAGINYLSVTGRTKTVHDGLRYANGVCLAHDGRSILIAESWACSVHRYWIEGPKAGTARMPGETSLPAAKRRTRP